MVLELLLHFFLLISASGQNCPPWRAFDTEINKCECGKTLHFVNCGPKGELSIAHCYCMTFNEDLDEVTVGQCLYSCAHHRHSTCHAFGIIQSNSSRTLNAEVCGPLKRTGHLCGNCKEGYGYPVYSHSLKCVKCNTEDTIQHGMRYALLAFGPLTIFYFIIILFKISITSTSMVAYIYVCQTLTVPYLIRVVNLDGVLSKVMLAYISMWNLEFFRSIADPFCLHPDLNALQVASLDYLVAFYPMLLIILTFLAVSLHDRYAVIVFLWNPVEKMMKCIRTNWNIRGSLIQVFATFFVLSYVKILNVSFELLIPVIPFNERGEKLKKWYLFSAGSVEYFGKVHLPYGILAITMLTIFNILPVIFLALYPFSWLKSCKFKHDLVIFTYLDTFYGCYRSKPLFCRSFAAVYFIMRLLEQILLVVLKDESAYLIFGLCQIPLCILIAFLQPYSKKHQNTLDLILVLNLTGTLFLIVSKNQVYSEATIGFNIIHIGFCITALVHYFYSTVLIGAHLLPNKCTKWIQQCILQHSKQDENLPLLSHN